MDEKEVFTVGERYSESDIWNGLRVPKRERTPKWQNAIYDFCGSYYVLCQAYNSGEGTWHECRRHLGELYCYGKPGVVLEPEIVRSVVDDKKAVHLFFRTNEHQHYSYLGAGKFSAYNDSFSSPLYIRWIVHSGDGLIPLRNHIDAFRRFCAYSISDDVWITDRSGDNLTPELLLDQLAIASSIENAEVNTCRFGDGTNWDSGILQYEARRSDLLSSTMAVLLSLTYCWMALETMLALLPLPKVPKELKHGAKLVDRCIYYLKQVLPDRYDECLLPGYETTLEKFRRTVQEISAYSRHVGSFNLQPHMNRWGLGISKVRNIRNKFIHGLLWMPEPCEPEEEEPEDDTLFELSARITILTMQLVLHARCAELNVLMCHGWGDYKEGDCAADALRKLHVDGSGVA